ncbi:MCM7, partial [Symbiodinium necroappetens]
RVLEKTAEVSPTPLQAPEVHKLRQIQVVEAEAILQEPARAATDTQSTQASQTRKGKRRQTASRAIVHLSHCSVCGSSDHRAPTCPQRTAPSDADQRKAKGAALEKTRRKVRLVSRLKYTPLHQRTVDYSNKSRQRSRATLSRDFLTFARMRPMELALALMEGRFGGESILGPLRQGQKEEVNITRKALHYRCQSCRERVTVGAGNPLFDCSGAGQHSLSLTILAFWNCVEGISITHTVKQLAVDEKVVSRWYRTARQIMVWDILRLQDAMVFGKGKETIDVEADESQFQNWGVINDSSGARTYYWYVWLGVIQRGNPSNFYLESLGVTVSHGEPRVPPLTASAWRQNCDKFFDVDANVVLMTDSAQAYASVNVPGIVEKHTVNHSEHEFSRSVSVLQNVSTQERRPGVAGTQLVDREWGHLKDMLPDGLSARTEEDRFAQMERQAGRVMIGVSGTSKARKRAAAACTLSTTAWVSKSSPSRIWIGKDASDHIGPDGWYSHSVLAQALNRMREGNFGLVFQPVSAAAYEGLLVNHDNTHWTCVAKHADALWHVDSLEGQRCIQQPDVASLLERFPSTFAIARCREGAEPNFPELERILGGVDDEAAAES